MIRKDAKEALAKIFNEHAPRVPISSVVGSKLFLTLSILKIHEQFSPPKRILYLKTKTKTKNKKRISFT